MKYKIFIVLIIIVIFRFFTTKTSYVNGQKLRLSGVLTNEPTQSFGKLKFTLADLKITTPLLLELHYGDYITVEGVVENGELKKMLF